MQDADRPDTLPQPARVTSVMEIDCGHVRLPTRHCPVTLPRTSSASRDPATDGKANPHARGRRLFWSPRPGCRPWAFPSCVPVHVPRARSEDGRDVEATRRNIAPEPWRCGSHRHRRCHHWAGVRRLRPAAPPPQVPPHAGQAGSSVPRRASPARGRRLLPPVVRHDGCAAHRHDDDPGHLGRGALGDEAAAGLATRASGPRSSASGRGSSFVAHPRHSRRQARRSGASHPQSGAIGREHPHLARAPARSMLAGRARRRYS